MVEHLTNARENCPLILDEVTVQCDSVRTPRLLSALHSISQERQVILFSQEQEIGDWAETHLDTTRDLLIRLQPAE